MITEWIQFNLYRVGPKECYQLFGHKPKGAKYYIYEWFKLNLEYL